MATTARQDKILATIERLNTRKEKFENGSYDKKYEKTYGDDGRITIMLNTLMTSMNATRSPKRSASGGNIIVTLTIAI